MPFSISCIVQTSDQPYITSLGNVTINSLTATQSISSDISGSAGSVTGAIQSAIAFTHNLTTIGNSSTITNTHGPLSIAQNMSVNGNTLTTCNIDVYNTTNIYNSHTQISSNMSINNTDSPGPALTIYQTNAGTANIAEFYNSGISTSTPVVEIDYLGNVGIGTTTNPLYLLNIKGIAHVTSNVSVANSITVNGSITGTDTATPTYFNTQLAALPTTCNIATNTYMNASNTILLTQLSGIVTHCNLATNAYVTACNTALNEAINAIETAPSNATYTAVTASNQVINASSLTLPSITYYNRISTLAGLASSNVVSSNYNTFQTTLATLPSVSNLATTATLNDCNVAFVNQLAALPILCNLATTSSVDASNAAILASLSSYPGMCNLATYEYVNSCNTKILDALNITGIASMQYVDTTFTNTSTAMNNLASTCNLETIAAMNSALNTLTTSINTFPNTYVSVPYVNTSNTAFNRLQTITIPSECNNAMYSYMSACNATYTAAITALPSTCNYSTITATNASNTLWNTTLNSLIATSNLVTTASVDSTASPLFAYATTCNLEPMTVVNTGTMNLLSTLTGLPALCNLATNTYLNSCNALIATTLSNVGAFLTLCNVPTVSVVNTSNSLLSANIAGLSNTYNLITATNVADSITNTVNNFPTTYNLATIPYVNSCNTAYIASMTEMATTSNLASYAFLNACNANINTLMSSYQITSNIATQSYVNTITTLSNVTSIGTSNTTTNFLGNLVASNMNVYGNTTIVNTITLVTSNVNITNINGVGPGLSVYQSNIGGTGGIADFGTFTNVPSSNATSVMYIGNNGYVGIGTTDPLFGLQVNGTMNVSSNLIVGGTVNVQSGNATTPTPISSDNSTKVATTAYVQDAMTPVSSALTNYAALSGATLTGTPTAPTASTTTNTTQIATTAFVQNVIATPNISANTSPLTGSNNNWIGQNTFTGSVSAPNISTMRNRIINGAVLIDQRGTALTPPSGSSSPYGPDRFRLWYASGYGVARIQQTPLPIPLPGFTKCVRTVCTTATTSTSGGWSLTQSIEGYNMADLAWGTANASAVTVSFWIYANVSGTAVFALRNSASNRSYATTYTISAANTWKYITITIPGDTQGTWLVNNQVGVLAQWGFWAASSAAIPVVSAWNAGNYYWVSTATNFMATVGNTICLTGVQFEKGPIATPFEVRPYSQELALCKRYYEKSYDDGIAPGTLTQSGAHSWTIMSANRPLYYVRFSVPKCITPTITIYNPSTGATTTGYNVDAASTGTISVNTDINTNGFKMWWPSTNTGQTAGNEITAHFTAVAEI